MSNNPPHIVVRSEHFPPWESGIEHSWINFYREERRWLRLRLRQEVAEFFNTFIHVRGPAAKGWKVSSMLVPIVEEAEHWESPLEDAQTRTSDDQAWCDDRPIYRIRWMHYHAVHGQALLSAIASTPKNPSAVSYPPAI